jgi:hypothetical protein
MSRQLFTQLSAIAAELLTAALTLVYWLYVEVVAIVVNLAAAAGVPVYKFVGGVTGGIFSLYMAVVWLNSLDRAHQEREAQRQENERLRQAAVAAAKQAEEHERQRRQQEEAQRQEQKARRQRQGFFELRLEPGIETFTPLPLAPGKHYEVTVSGVCSWPHWLNKRSGDAFYRTDPTNFTIRYNGLFLDGKVVEPIAEDRHVHTYQLAYVGTGAKLSALLKPPGERATGTLLLSVAPVAAAEQARRDRELAEEQRRCAQEEADRIRQEQERLADEQAACIKQAQAIEAEKQALQKAAEEEAKTLAMAQKELVIQRYRVRAHAEHNLLDPEYGENLARNKTKEVLEHRQAYRYAYEEIIFGTADKELPALIREKAPEVLTWLESWGAVIRRAEQLDTEPSAALVTIPPPARPKKKKLTEEQVRARKTYHRKRGGRDKIADKTATLDLIAEYDQQLKKRGLDDDVRAQLTKEFVNELLDEDNPQGKRLS